jgi:hypothetical protein
VLSVRYELNLYVLCRRKDCLCGQWSEFLAKDPEARVPFLALPKKRSGFGTGSTQPREYN